MTLQELANEIHTHGPQIKESFGHLSAWWLLLIPVLWFFSVFR